jgi:hypothetical protein
MRDELVVGQQEIQKLKRNIAKSVIVRGKQGEGARAAQGVNKTCSHNRRSQDR